MSKTRRSHDWHPEKEGRKAGPRPLDDSGIDGWEEDEDLDEDEDEDDEDDDWEPEWPDEDDDLRARDWSDGEWDGGLVTDF